MNRKELIQRYINEPSFSDKLIRLGYKEAVEKAFEWLCANMVDNNYLGANTLRTLNKAEFIQNFKKAMES